MSSHFELGKSLRSCPSYVKIPWLCQTSICTYSNLTPTFLPYKELCTIIVWAYPATAVSQTPLSGPNFRAAFRMNGNEWSSQTAKECLFMKKEFIFRNPTKETNFFVKNEKFLCQFQLHEHDLICGVLQGEKFRFQMKSSLLQLKFLYPFYPLTCCSIC